MITVASYNVRKAIGTDRRRDPGRVLDVINEVDADVIALQEADRRFGARLSALPPELIAGHTNYEPVAFDIRPGGLGWHGNAILVRRGTAVAAKRAIALPVLEPRGAVMAELEVAGVPLRVVGMHLDLSGVMRRRQVRHVIDQVRGCAAAMPTVLMGDLNEWSLHGGVIREFGRDWRIAPTGRSFHSRRPMACLDRIVTSSDVSLIAAGVHLSQRASRASDHLPVWARIALPIR